MCFANITGFFKSKMEKKIINVIVVGLLILPLIDAGQKFDMQNYCGKTLSMMLKSAYQLQLELTDSYFYSRTLTTSKAEMGACEMTVEAGYTTYRKLMFYFDDLDLDCDKGHLEFFVGRNSDTRVTGLEKYICGDKRPIGVFTVEDQLLRIKYVPRKKQYTEDIFSIIITAYGEGTCPSNSHTCDNERCMHEDIECNEYVSCDADECNADISVCGTSTNVGLIIGLIIGSLCFLTVIVCVICCSVCRIRKSRKAPRAVQVQQNYVPTTAFNTVSEQQRAFNQPLYTLNYGGIHPNSQINPVFPTGALPSSPTASGSQATYQEPGTYFPSSGQQPISPPSYVELYGDPDQQAPPVSDKQDHVYAELDNASSVHVYDNAHQQVSKQDSAKQQS